MRVLHVIPSLDKKYGGPSYAVRAMVRFQNEAGIRADIATTYKKRVESRKSKVERKSEETALNNTDGEQIVKDGQSLASGRIFSFLSCLGEYKFSMALCIWLNQNIQAYDLVHIHSMFCFSSVAAATIARKASIPYILRPLGQLYPWALANRSSIKKRIYLTLFEAKTVQCSSALHFTSQHEKDNYGLCGVMPKSYLLPLGVQPGVKLSSEAIRSLWPEFASKKIILSLSRLHPKKGLHLLIPWLSSFLNEKNHEDWALVIAGSGCLDYLKKLNALVSNYRLSGKVIFLGDVSGARKEALLQLCDLFILPSQSENFGIAVAEALSAGSPVLISDQVGLASDVVHSQSGLVFSLNGESFSKQFGQLIKNPDFRAKCAANAKNFAQKQYGWDDITQKQITLYEQIIKTCRIKVV